MGLDNLLATLEKRDSVTPVTSVTLDDVTLKPAWIKVCTSVTPVTAVNDITANDEAANIALPEPSAIDKRSMRALSMLNRCTSKRAIFNTVVGDDVILTVAIRGLGTCELAIPKAKFDPWRLLELVERHGATTH